MATQTKFLPRLENDPQTGPITFATDENQDKKIIFGIEFPIGLLNSLIVQNAGRLEMNGIYNYVDENDEKPYYTKGEEGFYYIIWINNRWDIYDFSLTSDAIYFSNEDTNYPWQVLSWTSSSVIYNPSPIIIQL